MIIVKKPLPPRREWKCTRTKQSVIARYEDTALQALRIRLAKTGQRVFRKDLKAGKKVSNQQVIAPPPPPPKPPRRPGKMAKPVGRPKYEAPVECPWPITAGNARDIEEAIRLAYRNGKLTIEQLKAAEQWENLNMERGTVIQMLRTAMKRLKADAKIIK